MKRCVGDCEHLLEAYVARVSLGAPAWGGSDPGEKLRRVCHHPRRSACCVLTLCVLTLTFSSSHFGNKIILESRVIRGT